MAYSSGKKYSKSGSSDKRGSSERFSKSKSSDRKPYKKRDDDNRPRKDSSDKFSRSKSDDKKPFRKREGEESSRRDPDKFSRSKNGDRKPFKKREGEERSTRDSTSFSRSKQSDKKPYKKREGEERSHRDSDRSSGSKYGDKKPFRKREGEERSNRDSTSFSRSKHSDTKPFRKRDGEEEKFSRSKDSDRKPFKKRDHDDRAERSGSFMKKDHPFSRFKKDSTKSRPKSEEKFGDKPKFRKSKRSFENDERSEFSKEKHDHHEYGEKKHDDKGERKFHDKKFDKPKHHSRPEKEFDGLTRLNKYLSNAGICSRREADDLIKAGTVTVNGKVVTEMGFKIKSTDVINYGGETLRNEKKVYILLNKPKDYITTTDDPQERHTVMELIEGACKERVYPVGRLDRNTVGLLLFTNDGEMASKLMHPKFGIKKVYQVSLEKKIRPEDFAKLENGLELEDGFIKPDSVEFVGEGKHEIGIEIHSGKNRIVRRIFEHLGYEVEKLDRVSYAGLTKKDLGRGKWRFLTAKEIAFLKMIG
jgi:23S rRNA pseudouridine2605 synthase